MAEFEGDVLLASVCCRGSFACNCRGLWLFIAGVYRHGLNRCLRLGFEWVVGLNRLWFLGWFQSFGGGYKFRWL